MNDLLPPARRSIPERGRALMRERLDEGMGTTTTAERRWDGAARRFGIPVAVAAVAAALAIGGYLLAGTGDDNGGDPGPAGQGGDGVGKVDTAPRHQGNQQEERIDRDEVSTAMSEPDQAYQKCVDSAVRTLNLRGEPVDEPPTGRLAIDNGTGITVVVANSTESFTCNVKPDRAVSGGNELDGSAQASDFWFALNVTSNVLPGAKGEMAWAGGELPAGVTGVTYTFPDGHTEDAVIQDGFWAMQYFSDRWLPTGPSHRVEVTLDGTEPRTFELPFNVNTMCNQISHGC
jgi:hypothetical protein